MSRELCLKMKAKDSQVSTSNANKIKTTPLTSKGQASSPSDQEVDINNNNNADNFPAKIGEIETKVINDQLETINNENNSDKDNLIETITDCDKKINDNNTNNKVPNEVVAVVDHHEIQMINNQLIICQPEKKLESNEKMKSIIDNNNNEVESTIN